MNNSIRLLMVDDNELARKGTAALLALESDMHVVGMASNGEEAVQMALELKPDIVLMDIHMPVMDGLEATRRIKAIHPDIKVLALTMLDSDAYLTHVMNAKAEGYALKSMDYDRLLKTIKAVYFGIFAFPPLAKSLVPLEPAVNETSAIRLTPRQLEIARLWVEGLPAGTIAKKLEISTRGVQTHIQNIYLTSQTKNRIELLKYLQKHEAL